MTTQEAIKESRQRSDFIKMKYQIHIDKLNKIKPMLSENEKKLCMLYNTALTETHKMRKITSDITWKAYRIEINKIEEEMSMLHANIRFSKVSEYINKQDEMYAYIRYGKIKEISNNEN